MMLKNWVSRDYTIKVRPRPRASGGARLYSSQPSQMDQEYMRNLSSITISVRIWLFNIQGDMKCWLSQQIALLRKAIRIRGHFISLQNPSSRNFWPTDSVDPCWLVGVRKEGRGTISRVSRLRGCRLQAHGNQHSSCKAVLPRPRALSRKPRNGSRKGGRH